MFQIEQNKLPPPKQLNWFKGARKKVTVNSREKASQLSRLHGDAAQKTRGNWWEKLVKTLYTFYSQHSNWLPLSIWLLHSHLMEV